MGPHISDGRTAVIVVQSPCRGGIGGELLLFLGCIYRGRLSLGFIERLFLVAREVDQAVLEHKGGNAVFGEPLRLIGSFLRIVVDPETASGTDDHGGSGGDVLRRKESDQFRILDVREVSLSAFVSITVLFPIPVFTARGGTVV